MGHDECRATMSILEISKACNDCGLLRQTPNRLCWKRLENGLRVIVIYNIITILVNKPLFWHFVTRLKPLLWRLFCSMTVIGANMEIAAGIHPNVVRVTCDYTGKPWLSETGHYLWPRRRAESNTFLPKHFCVPFNTWILRIFSMPPPHFCVPP